MISSRSNVADYELIYHGETDRAIKVARDEEAEAFWLPLSQVEVSCRHYTVAGDRVRRKRRTIVTVTIPDWLAEKHDLA